MSKVQIITLPAEWSEEKHQKCLTRLGELIEEFCIEEKKPEPVKCKEWWLVGRDNQPWSVFHNRPDRVGGETVRVIEPLPWSEIKARLEEYQVFASSDIEIVLKQLGMIAEDES